MRKSMTLITLNLFNMLYLFAENCKQNIADLRLMCNWINFNVQQESTNKYNKKRTNKKSILFKKFWFVFVKNETKMQF